MVLRGSATGGERWISTLEGEQPDTTTTGDGQSRVISTSELHRGCRWACPDSPASRGWILSCRRRSVVPSAAPVATAAHHGVRQARGIGQSRKFSPGLRLRTAQHLVMGGRRRLGSRTSSRPRWHNVQVGSLTSADSRRDRPRSRPKVRDESVREKRRTREGWAECAEPSRRPRGAGHVSAAD